MQASLIAGEQVLVMLLLMAVGFGLYKLKVFSDSTCAQLNRFLQIFVVFIVIFSSFNRPYDRQVLINTGLGALFSACGYLVGFALIFLLIRGKSETARVDRFGALMPNAGFMGIPLVNAFLGSEAVIYASTAVLMFNLVQWTLGRIMLTGETDRKEMLKKIILNPGVLGILCGLVLFLCPFTLPNFIGSALGHIANLNTPIAMIVMGTAIARTNVLPVLKDPKAWLVCLIKLILIPACTLPVLLLVRAGDLVTTASYLLTACPSGAIVALFPSLLGLKEGEQRGSGLVAMTTALSILTLPLMILFKTLVTGA